MMVFAHSILAGVAGSLRRTFFGAALLLAGVVPAVAQLVPDVVWTTNAHSAGISCISFSLDGQRIATGADDDKARVWSLTDFSLVRALAQPQEWVLSVALSPDGSLVGVGTDEGRTSMWNVADGTRIWRWGTDNKLVLAVAFSHNGTHFVDARSDATVVFRQTSDGAGDYIVGHNEAVFSVVFSATDMLIGSASADGTAKLWRVSDLALAHDLVGHSNKVYSIDFSSDGAMVLTTSPDGTSRLWSVADGSLIRVVEGAGGAYGRFAPSGKIFLTCTGNGSVDFYEGGGIINVWRVSDGALLASYPNLSAGPLAVSPDGKYFAYGRADGVLVLARMPLVVTDVCRVGNQVTLKWEGGTGLYQLQARSDLASSQWQNIGNATTNTVITHSCLSPIFFRVQSLPNP